MLTLLKRLLYVPVVILLLVTATFFLIRLAPGGPFSAERDLPEEVEKALNAKFRLDQPMLVQYGAMLKDAVRGDFGPSMKHRERTVRQIIAQHLPPSMILGALAIILALWIGITVGTVSALKANSALDYFGMGVTVLGISLPAFVFGPLLQLLFAMRLDWLPVAGYGAPLQLVLPALTLSLPFAARFARLMRAGMLEVLSEDFIRTARSKGLSERIVVLRHAFRGALIPVVSFLGPAIAAITTGSLVVEKIFNIPGLGREFVESALNRDYTLVMGTTIVYGSFIVICNMLSDLSYALLDPRVRR
ncbi:MAG: ABC transporter permease [Kiritimatiellia bacterium]|jgi:oligopeptide transport system permease protein|nr:ABC transporter permease [Kiritimatiellia bacterium]MDP6848534.1 ABC transporter permease [Kiritimatiellia bacterium]